jgi:hypothetical protein
MPVNWTAGISAPDFPYPSHRDATILACRDWHLVLKTAWNQGMLGYLILLSEVMHS